VAERHTPAAPISHRLSREVPGIPCVHKEQREFHWRSPDAAPSHERHVTVYIGIGTVVFILLVILIVAALRRA
jgi:hypothetical protein